MSRRGMTLHDLFCELCKKPLDEIQPHSIVHLDPEKDGVGIDYHRVCFDAAGMKLPWEAGR